MLKATITSELSLLLEEMDYHNDGERVSSEFATLKSRIYVECEAVKKQ